MERCAVTWRHKASGREYCAQHSHEPVRRDAARVRLVLAMRAAGATWAQIGRRLGVSQQRAQQIHRREEREREAGDPEDAARSAGQEGEDE